MPLLRLLRALAVLLVAATALLLAHLTSTAVVEFRRTNEGLQALEQLRLTLQVTEQASRERGPTNGMLGDDLPHTPAYARLLAQARSRTDTALEVLGRSTQGLPAMERICTTGRAALGRARAQVDALLARPKAARTPAEIGAAVNGMRAVIPLFGPEMSALAAAAQASYPDAGDDVQAALLAAELREYAGLLGSHFTAALASGQPLTSADLQKIAHTRGRIDELSFLIEVRVAGPTEPTEVDRAWSAVQARYFNRALRLANGVIDASARGGPYGMDPAEFAQRYVPDMDSILSLRDVLLTQARTQLSDAHHRALRTLIAVSVGAAALLATLLLAIGVVQRRVFEPLSAVAKAVRAIARNDFDIRLPRVRADDEMAAIVNAVLTLRERQQQRQTLEHERDALITQLRELSNTDPLTGLANRRGFFDAGEQVLALARRHRFGVVAVMVDIDHFKQINDTHGHAVGDAVLYGVAEAIRGQLRDSDLAGRLGGEEFALLLNHCDLMPGVLFAERLRRALEAIEVPVADGAGARTVRITGSVGVASFEGGDESLEQLLMQADQALYHAKAGGRNRVVAADDLPTLPAEDSPS